jgi:hypothetical protein
MKMVLGGAKEAEAFLGDFQVTGAELGGCCALVVVVGCCAHTNLCVIEGFLELIPENHY